MLCAGLHPGRHFGHCQLTVTRERAFTILAFLLVLAAAVCLWRNNTSATFVLAALGGVAWFVGYRFRLRAQFPVGDDDDEPSYRETVNIDEEQKGDPRNNTN